MLQNKENPGMVPSKTITGIFGTVNSFAQISSDILAEV